MIAHLSKRKLSKFAKQEILDLLPEARCLKKVGRQRHVKDKKGKQIALMSLETKIDHPNCGFLRLDIVSK